MRRLSYSSKIALIYWVIVLLPLLAVTLVGYHISYNIFGEQAIFSNEQAIKQAASFIEYKVSSINSILNIISYDRTIQTLLQDGSIYARGQEDNWMIQVSNTQNYTYTPYISSDILQAKVYPNKSNSLFDSPEFTKLSEASQNTLRKTLEDMELFSSKWISDFSSYDSTISVIKKIPNYNRINQDMGYITGDIPISVFHEIIDTAAPSLSSTLAIVNSENTIITTTNTNNNELTATFISDFFFSTAEKDGSLTEIKVAGENYFSGIIPIDGTDWNLLIYTPSNTIFEHLIIFRTIIFLVILICFILSGAISYVIANRMTKRITKLQKHIEETEQKGFDITPLNNGTDEIGELTTIYDDMAARIKALMKNQFQQGYEIRTLELKVLQSTIDPHFLYNALDLIYWKALEDNDQQVCMMAKELNRFYKLSLAHGKTIVTLENELEHVKIYTDIQNMRFDGKISLHINVPENLLSSIVFKIMLQPIVENSILHGIREKDDETGSIVISAWQEGEDILIQVQDDGVGMTQERVTDLLDTNIEDQNKGYGIWNINERIRIAFGYKYGISISSKIGIGTTVIIRLPMNKSKWDKIVLSESNSH